jgi:hypothetical protein
MPDFFEKRSQDSMGGVRRPKVGPELRLIYPRLATMLEGLADAKGVEVSPAFSLTFFVGDANVRFCFSAKTPLGNETWFGVAPDDGDLLGVVETALAEGRLEAKRERDFGKGLKH